jgi:uncharacterized membrane protein YbhN (UPF0104 family)
VKSKLLTRVLPLLLFALAIGLAVITIVHDRHQLGPAVSRIGPTAIVLATISAMLGVAASAEVWRQVLIGLGAHPPAGVAARVFFPSQLGKYLPGSVWPVVAQMEFGRRVGINRRRMLSANALALVLGLAVGLVVAGVCLPLSSTAALHRYWWTFAFLPLMIVCLHPRLVPGVIDAVFRRLGRESIDARLPVRGSLRASTWSALSWLGMGTQVYLLARPFTGGGSALFLASLGGMALAVSAGILVIPVPAGAGIRDAVLLATLAPALHATDAFAVALVSRASLIAVDLLLAGLVLVVTSRSGKHEPVVSGVIDDAYLD